MRDRSYNINVAVALQSAADIIHLSLKSSQGERSPAFATITTRFACFCVPILVLDTGKTVFLAVLIVIQ